MVIQDKSNTALHFDGTDDYVSVPYSLNLNPDTFTISTWAKVEGSQGNFRTVIASRDENRGYILYAAENNHWQFWVGNGTSWEVINGPQITLKTWTHLAGVYDGTQMIFYVDGVDYGSIAASLAKNPSFPLTLGKASDCNQYYFKGEICEVCLWNVACTADKIKADVNSSLTGSEVGLVGYWRLDEGIGITVTDSTGNNPLGIINGPIWTNDTPLASSTALSLDIQLVAEQKANQELQIQLKEVQEKLIAIEKIKTEVEKAKADIEAKLVHHHSYFDRCVKLIFSVFKYLLTSQNNDGKIRAVYDRAKTVLQPQLMAEQNPNVDKATLSITTNLEEISCAKAHELKSIKGNVQTFIFFKNQSNSTIKIYWLDYYGKRKLYNTLFPSQQWREHTYLTHPWMITDENDQCLGIFLPKATKTDSEVIISEYECSS
jgi:hypothetical protein